MNKRNIKTFSPKERANSFKFAFKGLKLFFFTQHNSWIHLLAAFCAISAGFIFGISKTEWLFVVLAITLVLIAEILNTAIEFLVDFVSPQHHEMAGKVKDLAAGAVLFAALMAAVIGVMVFLPDLLEMVNGQ